MIEIIYMIMWCVWFGFKILCSKIIMVNLGIVKDDMLGMNEMMV